MPRVKDGPGPASYQLPSLLGYTKHDLTKYCNPAYSMGLKTKIKTGGDDGPGPKYPVYKVTVYGKDTSPEYSLKSRHPMRMSSDTPGPDAYKVEIVPPMSGPRAPQYSIYGRTAGVRDPNPTPAPNTYVIPTTIGPKVPDKIANAAYSMSFRQKGRYDDGSPGPAAYKEGRLDSVKYTPPAYSMSRRVGCANKDDQGPGPKYLPKLPQKPGYSFGLRTDTDPYITAADNVPCIYDDDNCN